MNSSMSLDMLLKTELSTEQLKSLLETIVVNKDKESDYNIEIHSILPYKSVKTVAIYGMFYNQDYLQTLTTARTAKVLFERSGCRILDSKGIVFDDDDHVYNI